MPSVSSLSPLLKCVASAPQYTIWTSTLEIASLNLAQDPLERKPGTSVQLMGIVVYKQVSDHVVRGMLAARYHLRHAFHLL